MKCALKMISALLSKMGIRTAIIYVGCLASSAKTNKILKANNSARKDTPRGIILNCYHATLLKKIPTVLKCLPSVVNLIAP